MLVLSLVGFNVLSIEIEYGLIQEEIINYFVKLVLHTHNHTHTTLHYITLKYILLHYMTLQYTHYIWKWTTSGDGVFLSKHSFIHGQIQI